MKAVSPAATRAELRWLGHLNRWWTGTQEDLRRFVLETDAILNGEHQDDPDDSPLRGVIGRLRDCENRLFRAMPPSPSDRTRRLDALMTDACFAVEDVAGTAAQIIANGATADLKASLPANADHAGRLLYQGIRRVNAFDPSLRSFPRVTGLTEASHVDPRFGNAARAAAGKKIAVRCWSREDWAQLTPQLSMWSGTRIRRILGVTTLATDSVNLSPLACAGLGSLVYGGWRPSERRPLLALGASVNTLAHEAMHARGVADEAVAECFGMQFVERTAKALGVETSYARRLAKTYWSIAYRFNTGAYRSSECRPGGAMDLRPHKSAWPS